MPENHITHFFTYFNDILSYTNTLIKSDMGQDYLQRKPSMPLFTEHYHIWVL